MVYLMFMGPCVIIIWYVIPTRCTGHSFLFNLITALHVSGVVTTHPQEHKATASTASGNRYTVLLSAAQQITVRCNGYKMQLLCAPEDGWW